MDNKKPNLEGVLVAITDIVPKMKRVNNGVLGPGGFSWDVQKGLYTEVVILDDKGEDIALKYEGIVLPDTIGNRVEIYNDKRVRIFDVDLNRWYK